MKTRIKEAKGLFQPQYRFFFIWFPMVEDGYLPAQQFGTLENAKSFVDKWKMWNQKGTKIHEY